MPNRRRERPLDGGSVCIRVTRPRGHAAGLTSPPASGVLPCSTGLDPGPGGTGVGGCTDPNPPG